MIYLLLAGALVATATLFHFEDELRASARRLAEQLDDLLLRIATWTLGAGQLTRPPEMRFRHLVEFVLPRGVPRALEQRAVRHMQLRVQLV